jgi:hypothetical protein
MRHVEGICVGIPPLNLEFERLQRAGRGRNKKNDQEEE